MNSEDVQINLQPSKGTVEVDLPQRLTSTEVDELSAVIMGQLKTKENETRRYKTLHLLFQRTEALDSLGLNLVLSLIEWGMHRNMKLTCAIKHDLVHSTLKTVWLLDKMEHTRIE